jgi:uncharacterized protein YdhG (YjbR/CyaY superfamily)
MKILSSLKIFKKNAMTETNFTTIDEYVCSQASHARIYLEQIRQIVKKTAPEAQETISYQMPAFKLHGLLLWFAAAKNHYAIYPKAEAIEMFREKLKEYQVSKGTIRFSYDKPLPVDLVTEIVTFCVQKNLEKEAARKSSKKKKA